MSGPIVYISHFKVKEGKLEDSRQFTRALTERIRMEKPHTVVFLQYLNEEGTAQSVIHVFPDADAFDRHSEGVAERVRAGFEFVELTSREVYGTPSNKVLAMLRPPEGSGITLTVMPQLLGGYIRLQPV
jgi:hypothetical protein